MGAGDTAIGKSDKSLFFSRKSRKVVSGKGNKTKHSDVQVVKG